MTPAVLRQAASGLTGALAVKMEELGLLMESYDAAGAAAGQNPDSRLTRLLAALETGNFAAGKRFYFDGFVDFNGVELEIIGQLLTSGAEVSVNLTCDRLDGGQQVFAAARETGRRLTRVAEKQCGGCRLHETVWEADGPLGYLQARLFGGVAQPYPRAQHAVHLTSCAGVAEECRVAAGEILRLVQEGCRWRDIAVACPDLPAYRPVLESALRRAGIPAYFAGTKDILQEPVIYMIRSALEAATGGMEQEAVLAYLKSGFSPLRREQCDRLENYALQWRISGNRWERDWTMNPNGFRRPPDEATEQLLAELNALRRDAVGPLSQLRQRLSRAKNTGEMTLALYNFLEALSLEKQLNDRAADCFAAGDLQKAQEYAQVYGVLCTVLEQTYGVLGSTVRTPEEFCRIFRAALSQYDVGTIPARLDCVSVGSVMNQRQGDCPYLFLLGANEGVFPAAVPQRSLLTDQERIFLTRLGVGVAPTASGRLDRELAAIYGVLATASQGIFLSAVQGREAYFFRRTAALFPDGVTQADGSQLTSRSPRAYLTYLAADPRRIEAARRETPELTGQALQIAAAGAYEVGRLRPETVRAMYGTELRLSSSKIEALSACRFAYFLNYGLRAEERKPADFDAPLYGTFVHDVLEHTARQVEAEGGFSVIPLERVLTIAQDRMEQYAATVLVDLQESPRMTYLFRRTFDEVRQVVTELYGELSVSQFRPAWFELEFSGRGALPAVRFAGAHCRGQVEGFVDRADVWQGDGRLYVRVVDYKTGKKDFDYTNVLNGLGLQMLLYLFALGRTGEGLMGRPLTPSGVLYFPARVERIQIKDKLATAELEKARRNRLRRKGLLLNSDPVLLAMEPEGQEPRYLPYDVDKKTGGRRGDLASAEQLALLERHVFRTVAALGDELCSGRVDANPYVRDRQESACAFCPYHDVCGTRREFRWLKKVEREEFWTALEDREGKLRG